MSDASHDRCRDCGHPEHYCECLERAGNPDQIDPVKVAYRSEKNPQVVGFEKGLYRYESAREAVAELNRAYAGAVRHFLVHPSFQFPPGVPL
jgi:hypothetical protein